MKLVKHIYFQEDVDKDEFGWSGLIIELENGTQYKHYTENTLVAPFTKIERITQKGIEGILNYHKDETIHPIQIKIIELAGKQDISQMSLREIGKAIGIEDPNPQKIKHHILQIKKRHLNYETSSNL